MPLYVPPVINGHRYAFASIELEIAGVVIVGFRSINYSDRLTPGSIYGTGAAELGRTKGKYEAECEIEMYRREWDAVRAEIARLSSSGREFGTPRFDVRVGYAENVDAQVQGTDAQIVMDRIVGCRVVEVEASGADGPEALAVRVRCKPRKIFWSNDEHVLEHEPDVVDTTGETPPAEPAPRAGEV